MEKTAPENQKRLYLKWKDIMYREIDKVYPNFDEKRKIKLAQENARGFISVFTPTTCMVYTTSYRQWSYLLTWIDDLLENNSSQLILHMYQELNELKNHILKSGIGTYDIKDSKDRCINFLVRQTKHHERMYSAYTENYVMDTYSIWNQMSLSCLAQAQRHRTISYYMDWDCDSTDMYVPDILSESLTEEWRDDVTSIITECPQCIQVRVLEQGSIYNFILKCKERLCGRAQLEIAQDTAYKLDYMRKFYNGNNHAVQSMLDDTYNFSENRVKAKCELTGTCKEACEFHAKHAVDRLI
jgi:hypothetical protein